MTQWSKHSRLRRDEDLGFSNEEMPSLEWEVILVYTWGWEFGAPNPVLFSGEKHDTPGPSGVFFNSMYTWKK